MEAINDILEWSTTKLSAWRQDALRRLAYTASLMSEDEAEMLRIIKKQCGFDIDEITPDPVPLTLAHFTSVPAGPALQLKCIRNVRGVNRLEPMAGISFCPQGLTIIYGRNGSGKSGFVRIFRSACRTRLESQVRLKVLGDVYRSHSDPQDAEIVVNLGQQEVVVPWRAGDPAPEILLRVCVFDSAAAQFYIDHGNHIHYLPFGLALPHRLNELCISLKKKIDLEHQDILSQLAIAKINFAEDRHTKAQIFLNQLSGDILDEKIEAECVFSREDEVRLQELTRLLMSATDPADLEALLTWADNLLKECVLLESKLLESELARYVFIKKEAIAARTAASLSAADLFSDEPLPGVGSDTWRRLWLIARDYSVSEAYPGHEFPVVSDINDTGICIFCQQPLSSEASARLGRFAEFVNGLLAEAAKRAEAVVVRAIDELPVTTILGSADWPARLEQIRNRDEELAETIESFRAPIKTARRAQRSVDSVRPQIGFDRRS